jgi:hypothetical protein
MKVCSLLLNRIRFYDSGVVQLAFLAMFKQILLHGDSAAHLIRAIAQCSLEDRINIFSCIIRMWIECIRKQIQNESIYLQAGIKGREDRLSPGASIDVDANFHSREMNRLFEKVSNADMALYNIIIFATDAARWSGSVRRAMLDAGALSLVIVAFVNADFLPSNLMIAGRKGKQKEVKSERTRNVDVQCHTSFPIPSDVIQAEASTLAVLMHDPAFRGSWRDKQLSIRRRLCTSLVNALLGDFGQRDDRHAWTRSLFRKIVGC